MSSGSSPLSRGVQKSKGGGRTSIHCNVGRMFSGDLASNRCIGQLVPCQKSSLDRYVVKLEVDKFDPEEHVINGAEFGD